MVFFNICSSLFVPAVVISVSVYEYIAGVDYLETLSPLCNTTYSIYTRFLHLEIVFLSIIGNFQSQKLINIKKWTTKLGGKCKISARENGKKLKVPLMIFLAILRGIANFRLDSHWRHRLTNHLAFLLILRWTLQFENTLIPIRNLSEGLKEKIRSGRKCRPLERKKRRRMLKRYLVFLMEIRCLQESANDALGKQSCLIQCGILFGSAVSIYLLAYLNLQGWSCAFLNLLLFVDAAEFGFTACSFAGNGQTTSDSAKAALIEIARFSATSGHYDEFELVKQFALGYVSDPPSITAWTFYPLNTESLFSTISTTVAFVFILLQFNSVYSNFDLPII